jgi:hypothetical protein
VPAHAPLPTLLSQALVAFTIELDNEFERRFDEAGGGARVTSLVMWSNLLRFVGDGIAVGELPDAVGLQKPRVLSTLGGVERWRYVYVTPTRRGGPPTARRDGFGSARGLKDDWCVRLTPAGKDAAAIWPDLFGEIEARWRARFGESAIDELESALREIAADADVELPEYLPIVGGANGMVLDLPRRERRQAADDSRLTVLLARALLVYTLDYETESGLSLPLSANVVRVLDEAGVHVRELPARSGISKEAIAMALTFLAKTDYVALEGDTSSTKVVRLTSAGRDLCDEHPRLCARVEGRLGRDVVGRVRSALDVVLGHRDLGGGLQPHPGGWRAGKAYAVQTQAVLADPRGNLPHYPMVLHRGGWPDGS